MSPRLDIDEDERDGAQDEPRRRGQGVRAALLALLVTALVGGSWWAGHSSKFTPQDVAAVPEIHPDTAPVKEAPKDPGGMVVPGQDSVLLNRDTKEKVEQKGKPEELLPAPEAVKLRPAAPPPPPQAATASPLPPAMPSPPVNVAPPSPPAAVPGSTPQVALAPPAPPPAAVAPKPAAPASVVPKIVPPSPPVVAGSGYRLQLGALKTEEAAKTEWLKLQRQNADVLGKLSLSISPIALSGKGTYYRIQAGPIADEGRAAQSCASLKTRNVGCILVKP
jgi:hypothetical protein